MTNKEMQEQLSQLTAAVLQLTGTATAPKAVAKSVRKLPQVTEALLNIGELGIVCTVTPSQTKAGKPSVRIVAQDGQALWFKTNAVAGRGK